MTTETFILNKDTLEQYTRELLKWGKDHGLSEDQTAIVLFHVYNVFATAMGISNLNAYVKTTEEA